MGQGPGEQERALWAEGQCEQRADAGGYVVFQNWKLIWSSVMVVGAQGGGKRWVWGETEQGLAEQA